MRKHRIKLRRGNFSTQRIEKYKNYGQLMEKHRRAGHLRMGNYLIGMIVLVSVIGMIYYALDRIEDFEFTSSSQVPNQDQPLSEFDSIKSIKETPPVPEGGLAAYYEYVEGELVYPQEALTAGIEGIVYVAFDVDVDGSISQTRVIKGIGYGCDEVALELIKSGPSWMAGKRGKQVVKGPMVIPVAFKLEVAKKEIKE